MAFNLGDYGAMNPGYTDITVHFAGFSARAYQLQSSGWDLSLSHERMREHGADVLRLALKHKAANLYGVTKGLDITPWRRSIMAKCVLPPLEFEVCAMSHDLRFMVMPMKQMTWKPVSSFPDCEISRYDEDSIWNIVPFRTMDPDAEQIVVTPESVPHVLDLLLKCQAPKQAELRSKARRISAQIVTEAA